MADRTVDQELRGAQAGLGLQEEVVGATLPDEGLVRRGPIKEPTTPREWVKENLFSTPFNSLLTIVFGGLALALAFQIVQFVFFTGQWSVFQQNLRSYMVGRWPEGEFWRVWAAVYGLSLLAGLSTGVMRLTPTFTRRKVIVGGLVGAFALFVLIYAVGTVFVYALTAAVLVTLAVGIAVGRSWGSTLTKPLTVAWILAFPAMMVLFRGFGGVPPRLWGGFVLNITVAFVGIFASFPIGVLLALGRRSSLPVVRYFSVGVIELVRGNPLFILLIAGQFLLPFLLPPAFADIPLIIRAMAIYTIFSSVYVAEIVRGGMQGIHHGQYEASRALGLSITRMMALIILPQALRSTIPAMISHFISLFKDTSLLAVIGGFTDMTRAARRASAGLGQAGNSLEALLPAALLFWIVAFSMSRWSQRLEKRVGVGER